MQNLCESFRAPCVGTLRRCNYPIIRFSEPCIESSSAQQFFFFALEFCPSAVSIYVGTNITSRDKRKREKFSNATPLHGPPFFCSGSSFIVLDPCESLCFKKEDDEKKKKKFVGRESTHSEKRMIPCYRESPLAFLFFKISYLRRLRN
jgi:hypothetical protein